MAKIDKEPLYPIRRNFEPQTWDPGIENKEPSMVQPEHAEETEINNVMARYARTGLLPVSDVAKHFADLSVPFDFNAAQDIILEARRRFLDMPFEVRDEFRTAESLLEAFQTKTGRARLEAIGVLQRVEQEPSKAPVAGSGVQPQKDPEKGPAS